MYQTYLLYEPFAFFSERTLAFCENIGGIQSIAAWHTRRYFRTFLLNVKRFSNNRDRQLPV